MGRRLYPSARLAGLIVAAGTAIVMLVGVVGLGSAASKVAPRNTGEPRISGSAVEGATLTASTGSWSGTQPITFKYQWLRCDANAGNCSPIAGETRSTTKLGDEDIGHTIRVRITASNDDGTTSATANATDVVKAAGNTPANSSPPIIGGAPTVGQTLTANPGNWSGTQPISYSYQWRRCDTTGGSCSSISAATARTYMLKTSDAKNTLRVQVRATNKVGSAQATSVPTAVITTGPTPPATGCPSGTGSIQIGQLSAPARLLVDRFEVSPSTINLSTSNLIVRFHVTACSGRAVQGAMVYVTGVPYNQFSIPPEAATSANGWAELDLRRLQGFPAAQKQQLLVMFVRARKQGENLLAGISTRRLISTRVDLGR